MRWIAGLGGAAGMFMIFFSDHRPALRWIGAALLVFCAGMGAVLGPPD